VPSPRLRVALSLDELNARLDLLQRVRFSPTKIVRFNDGTSVTYNDDKELGNAIAALEQEIAVASLTATSRHLRIRRMSGYH
jgi:hypothetical protein